MSARRAEPALVRAERIAAFARRDLALFDAADREQLRAVMEEWDEARDFWVGPRIAGGRMIGVGLGFLLGHPDPPPFWNPDYAERMKERTRVAGGFTQREIAAVVLLEALQEDAIWWKHLRAREWRLTDREHRERFGHTVEFRKRRQEFFARYGSRRPREFWQQAVVRLRDETGLRPKEIEALFKAFRRWCWWWKASPDALEIALRRTKKLTHPSMRR